MLRFLSFALVAFTLASIHDANVPLKIRWRNDCKVRIPIGGMALRGRPSSNSQQVSVNIISDEADAVLAILAKRKLNQPLTDADWQNLFATEGYVRLKKREASLKRSFEDTDFKTFVLSSALLERAESLAETLKTWKAADVTHAAQLARAYLPRQAQIKAKIYPVIKPRENSFVFEVDTDPAIFLYLNPAESKAKFENTLAHELHHIGYGTACPTKQTSTQIERLPRNVQTVIRYIGAFGEGFAMLAAAGGPNLHPHALSEAKDRIRWDRDVGNFNNDLKKVEQFFMDVLASRLSDDEINNAVSSFFGEQGAWYTVGWKMCVTIEKTFGRRALIEAMCDQRKLLSLYNRAAAQYNRKSRAPLRLWSSTLIRAIQTAT
ncbi:MAG TPA: DUF5700 domain-containing putative Zn-dependent protease [Pyrinomonadaceae bacterium]|nr:DUF5700 domain-containing putative Zn-dependent protease [Pyrinomonadaceae bacterium]